MKIKPIKTESQYDDALAHIYKLMQANIKENSEKADELEVLSLLIKAYEEVHHPIPDPDPIEAIKFRMEQLNISEAQLSDILGTRSRKSEIFSGKRKLSLSMIRKLHTQLAIPANVLIKPY